jgi:hypothetical protein
MLRTVYAVNCNQVVSMSSLFIFICAHFVLRFLWFRFSDDMIRNRVVCVAPSASLAYSVEVVHTNISRYMLRLGRCNYRQLGTIGLHDQPVLEIHTMRAAAPGMSVIMQDAIPWQLSHQIRHIQSSNNNIKHIRDQKFRTMANKRYSCPVSGCGCIL